jgi:hypothetical protein
MVDRVASLTFQKTCQHARNITVLQIQSMTSWEVIWGMTNMLKSWNSPMESEKHPAASLARTNRLTGRRNVNVGVGNGKAHRAGD